MLQVNVELVDAATGAHLWADRFEADCTHLPKAQNKISSRLARTVELELLEAVGQQIEQEKSAHPNVRDLLLLGWAWCYRPTSNHHLQKALEAFQKGKWADARNLLRFLAGDGPSELLLEFMRQHPDGPPPGWDGVIELDKK